MKTGVTANQDEPELQDTSDYINGKNQTNISLRIEIGISLASRILVSIVADPVDVPLLRKNQASGIKVEPKKVGSSKNLFSVFGRKVGQARLGETLHFTFIVNLQFTHRFI
jgi:hypothetical protein